MQETVANVASSACDTWTGRLFPFLCVRHCHPLQLQKRTTSRSLQCSKNQSLARLPHTALSRPARGRHFASCL